jgi:hypothetical protein
MLSLRETQQRFLRGVLHEQAAAIEPWIGATGLAAADRLRIYRNNCREGFVAALALSYPVLQRLAGESCFRQLARDYQRRYPSPSGNLFHVGAQLPAFLRQQFGGTQFDYFSDVARLEWACQEVLIAPDRQPLDLARLAGVSPARYPRLRFELHPAARLVSSGYPVFRIWEAHQQPADPDPIDLASGGEQVLVRRNGEGIVIYRLTAGEFAWLSATATAQSLNDALQSALDTDCEFDLGSTLQRWVRNGTLVDYSVPGDAGDA